MGIKKVTHRESARKIGMWSTIADAVESGWGSVTRLIVVLVVLGAVITVTAWATSNIEVVTIIRTLLH